MRIPRLRLLAPLVLGLALCSGCHHTGSPTPATSSSSASLTPSPTPTTDPAHDMFTPGRAAEVVADLTALARGPIVRVSIDRDSVRLTYVGPEDRPATLEWFEGEVTTSDGGTDLVTATSFDPRTFNLTDVASLFAQAATIAGDDTRQELQINEYDTGQILMTVTTNPETTTVFFNPDGTPIPRLRLTVDADLATALADVTAGEAPNVITIDRDQQISADFQLPDGVVERRIRPANGPVYRTRRKAALTQLSFDAAQIDPAIVGRVLRTAPGMLGQATSSPITLTIARDLGDPAPRMIVSVGGQTEVLGLDGIPVEEGD